MARHQVLDLRHDDSIKNTTPLLQPQAHLLQVHLHLPNHHARSSPRREGSKLEQLVLRQQVPETRTDGIEIEVLLSKRQIFHLEEGRNERGRRRWSENVREGEEGKEDERPAHSQFPTTHGRSSTWRREGGREGGGGGVRT
jgi:hypothetical protein